MAELVPDRRKRKVYTELVVDPDRVLPLAITRQGFKAIAWRRPQVAEIQDWLKENLGSFRKKQASHWFCGLRRRSIFW